MANNEKEHAKLWFKELNGIGTTIENLAAAAAGEHEEWTEMYRTFAIEAAEEGKNVSAPPICSADWESDIINLQS